MLDAKLVEIRHVTLAAKQLLQKWNNPALASQKRLILTKRLLSDSTKKALNEEYERIRRLARQNIAHREGAENRLVLDYTEFVTVNGQLLSQLKTHQIEGVRFMWYNCFESIHRIKEHPGSGCVLRHGMGLGKYLQVVSLVQTLEWIRKQARQNR